MTFPSGKVDNSLSETIVKGAYWVENVLGERIQRFVAASAAKILEDDWLLTARSIFVLFLNKLIKSRLAANS